MAAQDNLASRRSARIPRIRLTLAGVIINTIVLLGVVVTIVPYLYMISSSFKSNGEIFGELLTLWPRQIIGSNYRDLVVEFPYARWYLNTIIVAVVGTALNVFLASLAGFAFAKYQFRFRGTLFVILLFTFMLPGQVLLLPQFIEVSVLGWYNTYLAVIVPGAVSAFGIFLIASTRPACRTSSSTRHESTGR